MQAKSKSAATVDEYLAPLNVEKRVALEKLRRGKLFARSKESLP